MAWESSWTLNLDAIVKDPHLNVRRNAVVPVKYCVSDDLVQRLYAVDTTLIIINERLGYLADRIMGQDPESDMVAEKERSSTQIVPPMIHQLSDGITTLERQAARIEQTINRFNGLV